MGRQPLWEFQQFDSFDEFQTMGRKRRKQNIGNPDNSSKFNNLKPCDDKRMGGKSQQFE